MIKNQTDLVGKILQNQFRVDSFLASGGMGAVYRVWDFKRNVPLAMKVLHSELAEDPTIYKRFIREANALKKLAHPNIVPFYGMYQSMGFVYMLEGFIDGPSLKDILYKKKMAPLKLDETLMYLKAITAALSYAHANAVVHCDVKPGNILIDHGGMVYLADFGIVRQTGSTSTNLIAPGTAAYMAPEQIRGESVMPATDIYALGVLLFEMLTGRRPFRGDEVGVNEAGETVNDHIRYAHLHLQPPDPCELNSSIPKQVAQTLLIALDKDPQKRYQSVSDFFEDICTGAEISADVLSGKLIIKSHFGDISSDSKDSIPRKKVGINSIHSLLNALLRRKHPNNFDNRVTIGAQSVEDKDITEDSQYDLVIPLESRFSLSSRREIFVGRKEEINRLVSNLILSEGGTFLIAGYRGVGKTTFLKQSLSELKSRIEETNMQLLVDIWLNIPKVMSAKELMHLTISSLYERLIELELLKALDKHLQNDVGFALDRISADIEEKRINSTGMEGNLSVSSVPSFGLSAKKTKQTERITHYRDYDASLAEQNLIGILRRLGTTKTIKGIQKKSLKIVFVFDELDKIDNIEALEGMLIALKGLFTDSYASFIFSVGKNQYQHWNFNPTQIENSIEGIVSNSEIYLPCLWNNTDEIFVSLIDHVKFYDNNSAVADSSRIYQDFMEYLSFKGRGVPRRLWKTFSRYIFTTRRGTFLGFKRLETRKFRFYSELQYLLTNKLKEYSVGNFDIPSLEYDAFRMCIYHMIDWILKKGDVRFTLDEALECIKLSDEIYSIYLKPQIVKNLLTALCKNEYIEFKDNHYHLGHRRSIEAGDVVEEFLTGDLFLPDSNIDKDQEISSENDTVIQINIHHKDAIDKKEYPNDWVIKFISTDNKILIQPNPRMDDVYEKYYSSMAEFEEKIDIGRGSNNDLELFHPSVSRYHARLLYSMDRWTIADFNTANGTLLNGLAISKVERLSKGDVITIGKLNLVFE